MACCSERSVKLKKANYTRAKRAADQAVRDVQSGRKPQPKKAKGRKAPARKAKPCKVCGKAKA